MKKIAFSIMLVAALAFMVSGILKVNTSFALSDNSLKVFDVTIDELHKTNNINVIYKDENYMSYLVELDKNKYEYNLDFTLVNNGNINAKIDNVYISDIPEKLNSISRYEITYHDNKINTNGNTKVYVKYLFDENSLTDELINEFNNYKFDLIVNVKEG